MPAMELLSNTLNIKFYPLTKNENKIFEAFLLSLLIEELDNYFKKYSLILKGTIMVDYEFVHSIVKDILESETYNISGIALYTNLPEDLIYDLAIGNNKNPTLVVFRKLIELHKSIRPDLYRTILLKAVSGLAPLQ